MTQNEIRLSAEILKTMFNITLNFPEPESTDTVEHCERIVFIVRSFFVHFKPLPEQPENLPNHAINVLSNMPTKCLKHLLWTMPSSVCKKLAHDYELTISSPSFRIQFEVGNFQSFQCQEKWHVFWNVACDPHKVCIVYFLSIQQTKSFLCIFGWEVSWDCF